MKDLVFRTARARLLRSLAAFALAVLACALPAAESPKPAIKPFGLAKRIPWTTSRVVGSPNPPLPYRVVQTFTKLKIPCPIAVTREPGADRLLLVYQLSPW